MKNLFFCSLLFVSAFSAKADDGVLPEGMVPLVPDNVEVTSVNVIGRTKADKPVVKVGDKLFFTATESTHGEELWVTDGTVEGTKMVKDIHEGVNAGVPAGSNPKWLTAVGDKLYFVATTESSGSELWVSDGTESGTKMVKDIYPGPTGATPFALTAYKGKVLFFAMDEESEFMPVIDPTKAEKWLWISDGTEAGTARIGNTPTKENNYDGQAGNIVVCGDKAYFVGYDLVNNESLWVTDGTEGGTKVLKNINPRVATDGGVFKTAAGAIDWITNVNDKWIVFRAETVKEVTGTVDVGNEIWMSDGTEAGTKWIGFDYAKGEVNGKPRQTQFAPYVTYEDIVFFRADDGVHGTEPGFFDLSKPIEEGVNPRLIYDLNHWGKNPQYESWPENFYVYQGDLYLRGNGGYFLPDSETPTAEQASGYSLWRGPLSTLDTLIYQKQIWNMEIYPGNNTDDSSWFTEVGGKLFFAAMDNANNKELWVIDNRDSAPRKVVDLPEDGSPYQLIDFNGDLCFASESTKKLYKYQFSTASGMEGTERAATFKIYPNPVSEWINISSEEKVQKVEIFSLTGSLVKSVQQQMNISVSDLPAGVYMVKIFFEDNNVAKSKLIIK